MTTTADLYDDEDLEDFDSEDLADVAHAPTDYLGGMWGAYSFGGGQSHYDRKRTEAADTLVAHGMVQSFVNAFSQDGHYVVSFSDDTGSAGTDMKERKVVITPAPIVDPTIDAKQAGLILTGLAVHEISHPRYGRKTNEATVNAFPGNRAAFRLSNLLDDIRIERRFVADFPGYAGIFEPVLEYLGKASTVKGPMTPRLSDPVNLAIAALRYSAHATWDAATSAEAAWWVDWAARGSREDAPRRHVGFIREALAHIAAAKAPEAKKSPSPDAGRSEAPTAPDASAKDAGRDDAEATEAGEDAAGDDTDAAPDDAASDAALNAATQDADHGEDQNLPSCSGSRSVDAAAANNGARTSDLRDIKLDAQQTIDAARNSEPDGHGATVDVAKSLKGLTGNSSNPRYGASDIASRHIRTAIIRSRSGVGSTDPFKRHGRLDQKGLSRMAHGDARVFEKRTAPAPGKYLIWVMVDASSSMSGSDIGHAAQVAHAMASATQGTPSVRMAVWAWSSPFRHTYVAQAGVVKAWESGMDTDQIFRISGLSMGGTPDAMVVSWAARAIKKAARPEETPVLIIVSDGTGMANMTERVAEARRSGVVVTSVSFGAHFTASQQEERFGRGNYVPFAGSIVATARGLAGMFIKITTGR